MGVGDHFTLVFCGFVLNEPGVNVLNKDFFIWSM